MYQADRVYPALLAAVIVQFLIGCEGAATDAGAVPVPNVMEELEPIQADFDSAVDASDLRTAYDLLLPYADSGNHEAQFSIGLLILRDRSGQIFSINQTEREHQAITWIRQAAGQGNERAVRALYSAYERGRYGLPQSSELEECWRSIVTFSGGVALSDLALAASCMEADAQLFR